MRPSSNKIFAFHCALKILVNRELLGEPVVVKMALQTRTQIAETKNPASLIHLFFEGSEKPHLPDSEMGKFLEIDNDPDALFGEPSGEKIFHPQGFIVLGFA